MTPHSLNSCILLQQLNFRWVVHAQQICPPARTVQQHCLMMQRRMLQAAHQAGMSDKHQIATDFKQTEQCLIRLDACQRKITACQTTIEQYRASDIDAQDELADLTHLQREKVALTESLIGHVRIFRTALHGQL